MIKLNILKVIDQYGWAFHFTYQEQLLFTKHNLSCIKINDFVANPEKCLSYDIIYFHSPAMISTKTTNELIRKIKLLKPTIAIIGAYHGERKEKYEKVDAIVSISINHLSYLKTIYPDLPIFFMINGINTNYFYPKRSKGMKSFRIGYAGRAKPIKRIHLLDKLIFPVIKMTEHGKQYFLENRTQDSMLKFYHSIDCLVLTSASECMPRVILEAMACELPVISTSVGSVPLLIENTWLTSVNPEEATISETNKKLRKKIGKRNRIFIKKNFDWKKIQPVWDEFFESVYNKDYLKCTSISDNILQKLNLSLEKESNQKEETTIKSKAIQISSIKQKKLVVHLAKIPCANSGFELCQLINDYSNEYYSRYILFNQYSNRSNNNPFRYFPIDLNWEYQRNKCIETLKKADIIHIHHDVIDDEEVLSIISKKKIMWTLYNLVQSLKWRKENYNLKYKEKYKKLSHIITVADQPLQKIMFDYDSNIYVPLVKCLFNENTNKYNSPPLIVFAPTNRDSNGIGTKKYHEVLNIIEKLKNKNIPFDFDLIEGIPYLENLSRKKKADIIIDDVDPTYNKFHNNSIEGACFGAISLTNYSGNDYPFIKTTINTLEKTLEYYLTHLKHLREEQQKIVTWRKANYTPEKLLIVYESIYNNLLLFNSESYIIEQKNTIDNEEFIKLLKSLVETNIFYWVAKDTLINILKSCSPKNIIQLGVNDIKNKELILDLCKKNNISLNLEIIVNPKQNIKSYLYKEIAINIPKPLIKYIEKYTKQSWKKFNEERNVNE